jgi:glutathione peroxidase
MITRMSTPVTVSDLSIQDAKHAPRPLSGYAGKVLLMVNVASKCGFTPQYAGLEALHTRYAARGLVVMGLPCNDFGGQEPGTLAEIQEFCSLTYGVDFEIFDKVHAKGDVSPVINRLTQAEPAGPIRWNFEKFLVGKDGTVLARFDSRADPLSDAMTGAIERALLGN